MPVSITATPMPLPVALPQTSSASIDWLYDVPRFVRLESRLFTSVVAALLVVVVGLASRRVEGDRADALVGPEALRLGGGHVGRQAVDHVQVAGHAATARAHQGTLLAELDAGVELHDRLDLLAGLGCGELHQRGACAAVEGGRGRVAVGGRRGTLAFEEASERETAAIRRATALSALKPQRMRSGGAE